MGMTANNGNLTDDRRLPNGRFGPGNPGGGRKLGSRNAVSKNTLIGIQSLSSEAVKMLADRMRSGDISAIRLILHYTLPMGGRTVELDSPDPTAIIDAAAMGSISPDEAARLAQAFKTASDASETKLLKAQLEELEQLVAGMVKR